MSTTIADDTMPPVDQEVMKAKEELEANTGKTYKFREPRQNINDLLVMGAIQDAPTSIWEAFKMGLILALLFLLSFGIFYVLFFQYPSKNYKGKSDLFKPRTTTQHSKPKAYQPLIYENPIKPLVHDDEF
jgi:zona occludens toxin (predicted ATPase)